MSTFFDKLNHKSTQKVHTSAKACKKNLKSKSRLFLYPHGDPDFNGI